MAHWLVGVRLNELTRTGVPRFIDELQEKFRGAKGATSVVRSVPKAEDVQVLQRQHGDEFVEFYYVDEALTKAADAAKVKLNKLMLVFGNPPKAVIFTVIDLPAGARSCLRGTSSARTAIRNWCCQKERETSSSSSHPECNARSAERV